jgi:hypothetical protein
VRQNSGITRELTLTMLCIVGTFNNAFLLDLISRTGFAILTNFNMQKSMNIHCMIFCITYIRHSVDVKPFAHSTGKKSLLEEEGEKGTNDETDRGV